MKNVLERNCALLLLFLSSAAAVSAAVPESLPMPHPPTLGASSLSNPNASAYNAAVGNFTRATQEYAKAQASNDPAAWQTALADVSKNVNEIGDVIVALGAKGGTSKDDNTMNDSLRQMRDYLFGLEHDEAWDNFVAGFHGAITKYQTAQQARTGSEAGYQAAKAAADTANAQSVSAIKGLITNPRYQNNATLYSVLGYLDTLRDDPAQAVTDLKTAISLNPDDLDVRYNLANELEQVQPPSGVDVTDRKAFVVKQYTEAAEQLQIVLDALQKPSVPPPAPTFSLVPRRLLQVNSVKADLATALGGAGQTDKAVALFKEMDDAGKADPSNALSAPILKNYGSLLAKSADSAESSGAAAAILDRAAVLDPKDSSNLLNAGQLNVQAGQNDQAISDLNAALGPDVTVPLDATGKYNADFALAEAYNAKKDPNKAIAEFQAASQIQPDNPKPLYNAGVLQQQAGLDADAIASFRLANTAAAKLDSQDTDTVTAQTKIQVALGMLLAKSNSPSDLSDAASLLSQAAPHLPQDSNAAPVYATLGSVYARQKDVSKANAARVQALALNAHDVGSRLALADSYAAQNQPFSDAQAVEMYQQAVTDLPNDPAGRALQANVQNQIGVLYQRLKQYKKAQEAFRLALTLNPNLAAAQNNLGVTYELLNHKPAEALVAYRKAHRLDSSLPEASYNLNRPLGGTPEESAYDLNESGTAYFTLKRYAKALASFKRAAQADPQSAQIWNNVGATYQALGSQAAARAAFRKALTLDPTLTVARQNLGDTKGRARLVTYGHSARP